VLGKDFGAPGGKAGSSAVRRCAVRKKAKRPIHLVAWTGGGAWETKEEVLCMRRSGRSLKAETASALVMLVVTVGQGLVSGGTFESENGGFSTRTRGRSVRNRGKGKLPPDRFSEVHTLRDGLRKSQLNSHEVVCQKLFRRVYRGGWPDRGTYYRGLNQFSKPRPMEALDCSLRKRGLHQRKLAIIDPGGGTKHYDWSGIGQKDSSPSYICRKPNCKRANTFSASSKKSLGPWKDT